MYLVEHELFTLQMFTVIFLLICIWGPGSLELGNLNYKFINLDFK